MAEGRAGALEDYATAAFSVSGVKQDISLEDWKGGWASIVGGLNGKPTSQQFNMVTYILSALLNQAISDLSTVKGTANSALPKSDFTAKQIAALLAAYGLMEGCDADTVDLQARLQAGTFRLNAVVQVLAPPLMPAKTLAQCAMWAARSPERCILQTARYIM